MKFLVAFAQDQGQRGTRPSRYAAGLHAGYKSMRAGGRTEWAWDDLEAATAAIES